MGFEHEQGADAVAEAAAAEAAAAATASVNPLPAAPGGDILGWWIEQQERELAPLLDCWLQLMQQQLLQQPGGILHSIAGQVQECTSQQYQQQLPQPGSVLQSTPASQQERMGTAPHAPKQPNTCMCCPTLVADRYVSSSTTTTTATSSSSSNCSVVLDCSHAYCVSVLLALLQGVGYISSCTDVWELKLPALLVVLEALLRKAGPIAFLCSSSSSRGSSSNGGGGARAGISVGSGGGCAGSSSSGGSGSSGTWLGLGSLHMQHMIRRVMSAFCSANGGPLFYAMNPFAPREEQQQHQHQQHIQSLQQQFFALVATYLKVCRNVGHLVGAQESVGKYVSQVVTGIACKRLYALPPSATAAECKAVMMPWLVLLGQYILQACGNLDEAYGTALAAAAEHDTRLSRKSAAPVAADANVLRAALAGVEESLSLLTELLTCIVALRSLWLDPDRRNDDSMDDGSSYLSSCSISNAANAAFAVVAAAHGQEIHPMDGSLDSVMVRVPGMVPFAQSMLSLAGSAKLATEHEWTGVVTDHVELQLLLQQPVSGAMWRLVQLVQSLGLALCDQLAVPCCCNNPDCTNLAGASELQLVGGKRCVCGGCRLARYCSRSCQEVHWPGHRGFCDELAAAAAAVSAAAQAFPAAAQTAPQVAGQ